MSASDPRLDELAGSINDRLLDGTIRHGVYLERLKNAISREVLDFLKESVYPEAVSLLQARLERIASRGLDSGVWTTARYREMVTGLREVIRDGVAEAQAMARVGLTRTAAHEAAWQTRSIQAQFPVDLELALPSPATLRAIVDDQPFNGQLMGGWFKTLGEGTQVRLVREVNTGLALGESVDQMVRRVRGDATGRWVERTVDGELVRAREFAGGALDTTTREAEAVVRTAAAHVSGSARQATFEENSDVVSGSTWVATLDHRTCPVCAGLDGKFFKLGEPIPYPAHWGERCSLSPVLKTWREMGIDIDELPASTRASADGQVPQPVTYGEWLKGQAAAVQDEVLGPVRAQLFRDGELSIDRFADERNRLMTLDQLAAAEGVEVPAQYR